MNLEFADNYEALSESYGEIQQENAEIQDLNLNCKEDEGLIWVERQWKANGWEKKCKKVSTFIAILR